MDIVMSAANVPFLMNSVVLEQIIYVQLMKFVYQKEDMRRKKTKKRKDKIRINSV